MKSKSKTKPIVTDPMKGNLFGPDGLSQSIAAFGKTDPTQYVAPASALQQQAFGSVGNLGAGQAAQTSALDMAKAAGALPPPTATATNANAFTYNTPQLGNASLAGQTNIGPAAHSGYASILDNGGVSKYMDPEIQALVDATMSSYDAQTGRQRAAMEAGAAGSGAFGGSRYGIQAGQFDAESGRNRALTEAELRAKAYSDALGAAGMDTGFRQQTNLANTGADNAFKQAQAELSQQVALANAGFKNDFALQQAQMKMQAAKDAAAAQQQTSMFNAGQATDVSKTNAQLAQAQAAQALAAAGLVSNIGTAQDTGARADLGLTAALGEQQRGITSEQLNAVPTQLQMMAQLYGAIPPSAYIGSKSSSTTALEPILGNIAAAGASAMKFSDRRLKSNIRRIGSHGPLGIYAFDYAWGEAGTGVMADEVAIHAPHALGPVIGGYQTVDYARI